MIKTFRLKNFRAFEDTRESELKPITVLVSPNSGGKSSILQSLLLLKQTCETEVPSVTFADAM
jgi:AAA15 family ATPase/GTPase